jgi:hypothetical protein
MKPQIITLAPGSNITIVTQHQVIVAQVLTIRERHQSQAPAIPQTPNQGPVIEVELQDGIGRNGHK